MNDLNPIVKKLIESQTMSPTEWDVLLNEWDESGRIQWLDLYDDTDCLLSLWCKKNIPVDVVERLSAKYGKSLWTHQNNGQPVMDVLIRFASNHNQQRFETYFNCFMDIFSTEEIWSSLRKSNDFAQQWYSNAPTEFAFAIANVSKDSQGTLARVLKQYPQLVESAFDGKSLADILTSREDMFSQYINAGGSLFLEIGDDKKPLWQHLMHKKIYHAKLKHALESGLTRMLEGSKPQETDVHYSAEDWTKLQKDKHLILQERSIFEFEQELKKDWKAALKANKDWRKWVNPQGANVMHWLALHDGDTFARSAVNKKANEALLATKDASNNDTLIYFLLGLSTIFNNFTSKRSRKFVYDIAPAFLERYLPLCDPNPTKGVLPAFIEAAPDAFFKSTNDLPDGAYASDVRDNIFKSLPNTNMMLNGMTTDHWLTLYTSPQKHTRSHEFLEAYFARSVSHWDEYLTNTSKILFTRLMLSYSFFRQLTPEKKDMFKKMVNEVSNYTPEDYDLSLPILQMLTKKSWNSVSYDDHHIRDTLQIWLDKQVLIHSIQAPKTEDDEPVIRKRKM